MFIKEPWGLPLEFLVKIHQINPYLYSLCIYIAYAVLIYLPTMGIRKIIFIKKEKRTNV